MAGSDQPDAGRLLLTVERPGDLTTVVMAGVEKVFIDTMPETLIGAAPLPVLFRCSGQVDGQNA